MKKYFKEDSKDFVGRIECYDISNLFGTNPVASMVVFENGKPDKKSYRRFKIKTVKAFLIFG